MSLEKRIVGAVAVIFFLVAATDGLSQTTSQTKLIGPLSGQASSPQILVSSSRLHVIFTYSNSPGGQGQLFIVSSLDRGETFTNSAQIVASPGSVLQFSAAIGRKTNSTFLAWSEALAGQQPAIFFSRSTDRDQSRVFTAPVKISSSGVSLRPRLSLDADENIYLVWESGGASTTQREVDFSKSSDGGVTFSLPRNLSGTGTFAFPNVISTSGGLHVLWRNTAVEGGGVAYTRSGDSGTTFPQARVLSGTSAATAPSQDYLALAPVQNGFGFLLQDAGKFPAAVLYSQTLDQGETFSQPLAINGSTGFEPPATLFPNPQGSSSATLVAAWNGSQSRDDGAVAGLFVSCRLGSGPFPEARLMLPVNGPTISSSMDTDDVGRLHSVLVRPVETDTLMLYGQGRCEPRFTSDAVVNAASQQSGGVAPGELMTLYGSDLGPIEGSGVAAFDPKTGLLITSAAGVQILFDGTPAPLFYIGRGQINVQVPLEVAGRDKTTAVVLYAGVQSSPVEIPVAPSAPAFFTLDGSGKGLIVAIGTDGRVVDANRPAKPGETLTFFATGQGATNPSTRTGEPAPSLPPYAQPVIPVEMTIDGRSVDLQFVGLAPGFAGLLQINGRVPDPIASGEKEIRLKAGSISSPIGTRIVVGQ